MLAMPLDGSREGGTFGIPPNLDQFLQPGIVVNLFDCLFYYRPLVEIGSHIVRGRPR